jgi:hypothetical protein
MAGGSKQISVSRASVASPIEALHSAEIVIEEYGEAAPFVAVERGSEMFARGDEEGGLIWMAILRAIVELQRTTRRRGEAIN